MGRQKITQKLKNADIIVDISIFIGYNRGM